MGLPTTGEATIEIDAPPEAIYDLVTDVTRMGEWSPECVKCEWQGAPGQVGSTFKGHNKSGPARWKTVARVEVADRPSEFTFATLYKDGPSTRWSYRFEGTGPHEGHRVVRGDQVAAADRLRREVLPAQPPAADGRGHADDPRPDQGCGRELTSASARRSSSSDRSASFSVSASARSNAASASSARPSRTSRSARAAWNR